MRTILRQFKEWPIMLRRGPGAGVRLLAPVFCLLIFSCAPQKQSSPVLQDKPLTSFQTHLLQIAFDVSTAMPVMPHLKDRSKAQAAVVDSCFELNQPQRALGYIEKIGNWRKGAGYADYAFYCAEHGFTNDIQRYLNLAEEISALADQEWRRDRIKVQIAQTHLLLNQGTLAEQLSANLEKCESGKTEQTAARLCADDAFSERMASLDKLISTGDFDLTQNALKACVQLYDRFYNDSLRRTAAEEKLKSGWSKTPYFIRIDLLAGLAACALNHADPVTALRLVNEGNEFLTGETWPVEYKIPLMARLAALRFRCGETDAARTDIKDALTLFNEKQSEVLNIDKANALIPVAEAIFAMNDPAGALVVYKQALEVAVENPNSRPRAEDLSAICLSMAQHNIEPDEVLWSRIKAVQAGLGDPW